MKINRNILLVAAIATLLGLGLASSASAARNLTFSGNMQLTTAYGLPIPILNPIPGGTACPTCATTIPIVQGTSDEDLVMPPRAFYLQTGPNVFPLPQPTSYPFLTTTTSLTISNQSGTLSKGGGPGSLTWCPGLGTGPCTVSQGTKAGRFEINAVGEQFGGVMRMAGIFYDILNIASPPGVLRGPLPVPLSGLGGPVGTAVSSTGTLTHTTALWTTKFFVTVTFMPWTTGQFSVHDSTGLPSGPAITTGYDYRDASGAGAIQLVSGWMAHISGLVGDETHGQAVMTLNVPEPKGTLMLGTGLSLLFGLYWVSRRR